MGKARNDYVRVIVSGHIAVQRTTAEYIAARKRHEERVLQIVVRRYFQCTRDRSGRQTALSLQDAPAKSQIDDAYRNRKNPPRPPAANSGTVIMLKL